MAAVHRINDVDALSKSAQKIHDDLVGIQADGIVKQFDKIIADLKANWRGPDAVKNINRVIVIRNVVSRFRNALDKLAVESGNIAYKYREVQNSNLANRPTLSKIAPFGNLTEESQFSDSFEGVDVKAGLGDVRTPFAEVLSKIDTLMSNFESIKTEMLDNNFQEGPEREDALAAFNTFKKEYNDIVVPNAKALRTDIDTAAQNYMV